MSDLIVAILASASGLALYWILKGVASESKDSIEEQVRGWREQRNERKRVESDERRDPRSTLLRGGSSESEEAAPLMRPAGEGGTLEYQDLLRSTGPNMDDRA